VCETAYDVLVVTFVSYVVLEAGMRNHSNFTVVPVPGFLLVPVPVPAQRSKRKQIQLTYDCRLDVSQGDVHSVQTGCTRVQI